MEELQVKLVTLEKKTCDYDSVKAELEEKKVCVFPEVILINSSFCMKMC